MARKTEKRTRTVEEQFTTETTCDLCGRKAPRPGTSFPWAKDSWDRTEPVVKMRTGESYPEGGSGREFNVDICPDCFQEKLVPWLKSQGATVREEDWDW